ncbi:MAG: CPBP family intramembrane metalloprotease [Anaerolineae bacterium]|nr:CPBP family intramembrane metalloprotease [Anaerolineae bacterium]NUQ04643.1 CPBP family intramembrane metalloprotease [Anaerolineae bacterium]
MASPIRLSRHSAPLRFIVLHFALVGVVNLVFFAGGAFQPLASATGGLVTGSLVTNLIFITVLVAWLILRHGDLRLSDIGIIPARLPTAVALTVGLWLAAQTVHALAGLLTYGVVEVAPVWNSAGAYMLIGALVAQLCGNALFEEIAYRGFLFPQFFLRLKRLADRRRVRIGAALALSQGLFALAHIPNRLYLGMPRDAIALDLLTLTAVGVLFTLIYIKTDNLFLGVGIHALGNAPTTLFRTTPALEVEGASILIYLLVIAAAYGAPVYRESRRRLKLRRAATNWQVSEDFG